MEVGYRLHVLLTLELSLTLATSHNDTCSGGDGLFTVPGEKNENRSNHSGGVAARSCSAPTTESTALSLLVGGHQEGVVVNGSEDIFVSIKTTQKYHDTRLPPILLTWLQTIHPWQVCDVCGILECSYSRSYLFNKVPENLVPCCKELIVMYCEVF